MVGEPRRRVKELVAIVRIGKAVPDFRVSTAVSFVSRSWAGQVQHALEAALEAAWSYVEGCEAKLSAAQPARRNGKLPGEALNLLLHSSVLVIAWLKIGIGLVSKVSRHSIPDVR